MNAALVSMPVPKPTLAQVIIDRIREGASLEETKEYYRFLREIEMDEAAKQAKNAYDRARSLLEVELTPIARDCANLQTKSKYASLPQVLNAVRPLYSKYGIVVDFDTAESPRGATWQRILALVQHCDGYSFQRHIDMPADGKGAQGRDVMTQTHAVGSSVTYGRRYLLLMIFNLAVGGEDDDGVGAPDGPQSSDEFFVTPEQIVKLEKMIERTGRSVETFCQKFRLDNIGQLPASKYMEAAHFLQQHAKPIDLNELGEPDFIHRAKS